MKIKPTEKPTEGLPIVTNLTNPTDALVTKRQLAALANVSVRTVENWQRDKLLPFFKIRNVVRFEWEDVLEHFRKNFRINARGVPSPSPEIPKL